MDTYPRRPTGRSRQAEWCRHIEQLVRERTPLKTDAYGIERTVNGYWLLLPKSGRGGGSFTQRMIVKQIKSDWFNCWPYDKNGEHPSYKEDSSPNYIKVAKPWELRFSDWDGQTIDGITFSYAGEDLDWARRKATKDSITEFHIVVRPWYIGEIILAATSITGGTDATDDGPNDDGIAPFSDLVWEDTNQAAHAWAETDIADPGDDDL